MEISGLLNWKRTGFLVRVKKHWFPVHSCPSYFISLHLVTPHLFKTELSSWINRSCYTYAALVLCCSAVFHQSIANFFWIIYIEWNTKDRFLNTINKSEVFLHLKIYKFKRLYRDWNIYSRPRDILDLFDLLKYRRSTSERLLSRRDFSLKYIIATNVEKIV